MRPTRHARVRLCCRGIGTRRCRSLAHPPRAPQAAVTVLAAAPYRPRSSLPTTSSGSGKTRNNVQLTECFSIIESCAKYLVWLTRPDPGP
eukprot:3849788-Rhodomonas_salina.2